jgi:folate-dependent tRNA-U54 methylase TrmFO/GidA
MNSFLQISKSIKSTLPSQLASPFDFAGQGAGEEGYVLPLRVVESDICVK